MHDQRWYDDWNRPGYQDDAPLERMRGGRSDIQDGGDRGCRPDDHFRTDYGGHAPHHGGGSGTSVQPHDSVQAHDPVQPHESTQPHDGGSLGWDTAAWNDAGGFDKVLFGHLSDGFDHAGAMPPIIVFAIDHLDVQFNTLFQTTQIENTLVFLNASDGGSIDVGGGVNAIGLQSASTDQMTVMPHDPVFG